MGPRLVGGIVVARGRGRFLGRDPEEALNVPKVARPPSPGVAHHPFDVARDIQHHLIFVRAHRCVAEQRATGKAHGRPVHRRVADGDCFGGEGERERRRRQSAQMREGPIVALPREVGLGDSIDAAGDALGGRKPRFHHLAKRSLDEARRFPLTSLSRRSSRQSSKLEPFEVRTPRIAPPTPTGSPLLWYAD